MEDLEQPEYDVSSASCTQEKSGVNKGVQPNPDVKTRLRTLEDYEKAYDEMRSAFTRKTQELARVKQMQNVCEKKEGKEETAGEVQETANQTAEEAAPVPNAEPETPKANNSVELNFTPNSKPTPDEPQIALSAAARDQIIQDYLRNVAATKVPPVIAKPANDFAFTNLGEAKTINQVEKIVTNFFKTKGTNY